MTSRRLLRGRGLRWVGWVVVGYCLCRLVLSVVPVPALDALREQAYSVRMYDRHGRLMYVTSLGDGLRREWTPLCRVPKDAVRVFLAAEDRRYYLHPGADPASAVRALVQNQLSGRVVSGAGTVTMQLARIMRGGAGRSGMADKLREAADAFLIEARLTKPEILELWLNNLPFGRQVEGIGSAARRFFGVDAATLTAAEAAVLAVTARNPTMYDPERYPARVASAARTVLCDSGGGDARAVAEAVRWFGDRDRDRDRGGAGRDAWGPRGREAALEGGGGMPGSGPAGLPEAPHYVAVRAAALSRGVTEIVGSLDMTVQRVVQNGLTRAVTEHERSRIRNGAALVVNHRTGEVIAYVGTHDFQDDADAGQLDGVTVKNHPGSCLKPFLFALAVEHGFRPNTLLPDIPMDFGGRLSYVPTNFNNRYNGPVRLRTALSASLNVPAVYVLDMLGVPTFARFLESVGFSDVTERAADAGVGLAVGTLEVSLLELVRAFSVFARGGRTLELSWDRTTEEFDGHRVVSPYTAWLISDILSDDSERILSFESASWYARGVPIVIKTGTSDQFQDIWAVGSAGTYTIGVWLGNHHGETVIGRTGSSVPAALVASIARTLVEYSGPSGVAPDGGIGAVQICTLSGGAATAACPATTIEYLPSDEVPEPCVFHRLENGRTVVKYPRLYASWAASSGRLGQVDFSGVEDVRIMSPADGAVFYADTATERYGHAVVVEVIVPGSAGADGVAVFVDDEPVPGVEPLLSQSGALNPSGSAGDADRRDGAERRDSTGRSAGTDRRDGQDVSGRGSFCRLGVPVPRGVHRIRVTAARGGSDEVTVEMR